jgi:hypothetical protein
MHVRSVEDIVKRRIEGSIQTYLDGDPNCSVKWIRGIIENETQFAGKLLMTHFAQYSESPRFRDLQNSLAYALVACLDCPYCGTENVLGRVRERRTGFNSVAERVITCRHCDKKFTSQDRDMQVRHRTGEFLQAEYGVDTLGFID